MIEGLFRARLRHRTGAEFREVLFAMTQSLPPWAWLFSSMWCSWDCSPSSTALWPARASRIGTILRVVFWTGWVTVLASTFLINHFDLFGLRQVWMRLKDQEYTDLGFRTPGLYKMVRHPIMLGFLLAFWGAPVMTQGHLLFTVVTTAYIFVGIKLEERDLVGVFGERYQNYLKTVSAVIPMPRKGG